MILMFLKSNTEQQFVKLVYGSEEFNDFDEEGDGNKNNDDFMTQLGMSLIQFLPNLKVIFP